VCTLTILIWQYNVVIKEKGDKVQTLDFVIDNFLEDTQSPFRTSFNMQNMTTLPFSNGELTGIATLLSTGLAKMSASNWKVRGFKVYQVEYNTDTTKPLSWVRTGVLLQGEMNIAGTRQALPITKLPYGVGMYIVQNDSRVTGRPGKLLLKVGFWEEMVTAYSTVWKIQGTGTGITGWNNAYAGVTANDGEWGRYFADGIDTDAKMVNLHKGTDTPSVIVSFTQKHINKYRMPKPVLV